MDWAKKLQDETKNNNVSGFDAPYTKGLTVASDVKPVGFSNYNVCHRPF